MKMKPEHFDYLLVEIEKAIDAIDLDRLKENIKNDPRVKDPNMRLRWDILWASVKWNGSHVHDIPLDAWISDVLYEYLNDDHIDTALKKCMVMLNITS